MSLSPFLKSILCITDCELDVVQPLGSNEDIKTVNFKQGQCFKDCLVNYYVAGNDESVVNISFSDGSYAFAVKAGKYFQEVSERYVDITEILEDMKTNP